MTGGMTRSCASGQHGAPGNHHDTLVITGAYGSFCGPDGGSGGGASTSVPLEAPECLVAPEHTARRRVEIGRMLEQPDPPPRRQEPTMAPEGGDA